MKGSILENGYPHEEELDQQNTCAPESSQVEPSAGTSSAFKYQKLTEILNAKVGKDAVFSFFSEISQLCCDERMASRFNLQASK